MCWASAILGMNVFESFFDVWTLSVALDIKSIARSDSFEPSRLKHLSYMGQFSMECALFLAT
jgi:hypothetical protein